MMSEILTDEHQNNHVHWWHRTVILPPQQITNDLESTYHIIRH